jgi:hypothetical protein
MLLLKQAQSQVWRRLDLQRRPTLRAAVAMQSSNASESVAQQPLLQV